jgi:drug/metabolite transporter superfamily protein YnfA
MLTPERLLRLMIEFIFVLLGGLLIWLGLAGPAHGRTVDRHGVPWLVLSVALILWGLRGLYSPGQWWRRWQNWTRGLSLVLLGVLMLVISRVPFPWVGPTLAAGGGLLVLRGLIASYLFFRPS